MFDLAAITSTIAAAFLASMVEAVEAFTVVLAVGLSRSWRPALTGAGLALLVLAILVIVFGPLLGLVPLHVLQFSIGVLLVLFGMRWLRKAILRASGYIALHDEQKAFAKETSALQRQAHNKRADYLAGVTAFKAVLLEGVEVVFIVIAVGAGRGMLAYASLGAAAACLLVVIIGVLVHRPLSKIPENALKFVVGVLLTGFGIFWTGEGLGADWPGADLTLAALIIVIAVFAVGATLALRGSRMAPKVHAR